MAKKRGMKGMRGWQGTIGKLARGTAVGMGGAMLASKLPFISSWSPMVGILAAYSTDGVYGAVGFALASGFMGNIGGILGGSAQTSGGTVSGATFS